ncbi:MAG: helix-turn-helix domain-containing protein [Pseudomonadota bacterium]
MQEKSERKSNKYRSEEMRARLLSAARALFVEKGFAETSTPEIVKAAEVTRGALYHHFADKTDVFRAVVWAEAAAITEAIEAAAIGTEKDPLLAGSRGYFEAMRVPGRVRLMLIDAPAVLGLAEVAAVDAGNGRGSIAAGLREAAPGLAAAQVEALALILSAAFERAALEVAQGAPQDTYIDAFRTLWDGVVAGAPR